MEFKWNPYLQLEEQKFVLYNMDNVLVMPPCLCTQKSWWYFMYRNWTIKASKLWNLHLGAVGILPDQGFLYILGIFTPKIWHHYSAACLFACFIAWSSLYSDAIFTVMQLTSVFYGRKCSNLQKFVAISVKVQSPH